MRVLVACEFSGIVRGAFRERGHEAWSVDLLGPDDLPDEFRGQRWPNYHLEGDALDILNAYGPWDLLIAHPPCTYLANSGVRWLYGGKGTTRDPRRWNDMLTAAEFFACLLTADVPRVAVENPIMHNHARKVITEDARAVMGSVEVQTVQPWQFGHGEVKATQLWLRNLPALVPTKVVEGREARVHRLAPSPTRWVERSRTFTGIAAAMAEQWGSLEVTG